jgi:hypothetical protein
MIQRAAISTPDVGESSAPASHGTVAVVGIWRSPTAVAEVAATEAAFRVSSHLYGLGGGGEGPYWMWLHPSVFSTQRLHLGQRFLDDNSQLPSPFTTPQIGQKPNPFLPGPR